MDEETSKPLPFPSPHAETGPASHAELVTSEFPSHDAQSDPPSVPEPQAVEAAEASVVVAHFVPPPSSTDIIPGHATTRARKASSSSISVTLSPSSTFKSTRSPVPPALTQKASFMPSFLSMRTPTTAISRINAGLDDEQEFDFDVQPKSKALPVEEKLIPEGPVEGERTNEEPIRTEPTKTATAEEPPKDLSIKDHLVEEEQAGSNSAEKESAFRLNPLELEIRTTPAAGRGVFATRDIPARSIVEESPVLVLTKKEWDDGRLNDGVLGGYGFNWTAGGMGVGLGIGKYAFPSHQYSADNSCGIAASMFNHSPQPNVMFTRVAPRTTETDKYPSLIFRAIKSITKGEELYICYSADESKLWFSPDYKAEGDHVEKQTEEPTWIPPMVEDDEPTAPEEENPAPASKDALAEAVPVREKPVQQDSGAPESGDKKYLDRKARKQSKREKKVKKPKEEGDKKVGAIASVADDTSGTTSNGPDLSQNSDTPTALSTSDYEAALAKLDLVREITFDDEDIQREKALEAMEPATNGEIRNEVAWKLVKRIRGPVEAQEEDESRTGELQLLSPVLLVLIDIRQSRYGRYQSLTRGLCH